MKLDNIPLAFRDFDLYRYRRPSQWQKPNAEPTPQECADSCWANMQTAAGELAKARAIYRATPPGECQFALGEMNRLRAEQAHWRGLQEYHRARARDDAGDPRLPRERQPGEDG